VGAVTSAGAGLSLAPGAATADAVRDAAARLLQDGSFGQAASRIGRSIAQMPSPDEVCEVLERLP
jgi:UDP:flavonoid glycosyltransferase YjiC (YdhE family)